MMAIKRQIAIGKAALPDIAGKEGLIVRFLIPPGEPDVASAATRGVLPLRLAWQAAASPAREGPGVVPCDMYDGMVIFRG